MNTCPACGADRVRRWASKAGHAINRCGRCRALFAMASPCESAVLYSAYYDGAGFTTPAGVVASLKEFVLGAEVYRLHGQWLDIGYGEGGLLDIADKHGWRCHGIEVAPPALAYGRQRGWVVTDNRNDPRLGPGAFDVVTMIEFLEHVESPHDVLASVGRWLRPGGLLYLTTPNADSLNRRVLGPRWSVVAPPEHLTLWTTAALQRALTAAGFVTRRMRTEGYNPADLIDMSRGDLGGGGGVDRNKVGRALSESLGRSRTRRTVKAAVNELLSFLRLGDTLKVWAERAA